MAQTTFSGPILAGTIKNTIHKTILDVDAYSRQPLGTTFIIF